MLFGGLKASSCSLDVLYGGLRKNIELETFDFPPVKFYILSSSRSGSSALKQ
jgi:hypothetical protein